jgi:hypothetical protein
MNFGFNSNVRVGDATYHVQTEDRGPAHPFLDTVVYQAGRVVYKRSTSYQQFAAATGVESLPQKLHELLSQQHREVIAGLEAGSLSLHGQAKPRAQEPEEESPDGLEVCLANPKTCLASGNVTLEIVLRRRKTQQEVGDAEVEAFLEHGKERIHCVVTLTDDAGKATLKFPMPAAATEGATLVVRATDGSLYGELRFTLKAKPSDQAPAPTSR